MSGKHAGEPAENPQQLEATQRVVAPPEAQVDNQVMKDVFLIDSAYGDYKEGK